MEAPTITLRKYPATLVRPSALAALALCRSEDQLATDGHEVGIALGAAALRICWPEDVVWPCPRPVPWQIGVKMERYGRDVFDGLCDAGLDALELMRHCQTAYAFAVSSRIKPSEVKEAADFSEPPPGG